MESIVWIIVKSAAQDNSSIIFFTKQGLQFVGNYESEMVEKLSLPVDEKSCIKVESRNPTPESESIMRVFLVSTSHGNAYKVTAGDEKSARLKASKMIKHYETVESAFPIDEDEEREFDEDGEEVNRPY